MPKKATPQTVKAPKKAAHTKKIAKKVTKRVPKVKAPKVAKAPKAKVSAHKEQPAHAAADAGKVSKSKSPAKVVPTPEKKKLARTKTMAHTLKESKKILGDRRRIKKNRAVAAEKKAAAKKAHSKKNKAK